MPSCFDLDSAALWPELPGPNAPGEPIIGNRFGCFLCGRCERGEKERAGNMASPSPKLYVQAGVYPHSFIEAIAFLASSMLPYLPMDFIPSGILCIASHLWLAGSNTT